MAVQYKYRPYLSADAMNRIMSRLANPGDKVDKEIAKALAPILAKIQHEVNKPASIVELKPTLQEKLGISDEELDSEFIKLQRQFGLIDNSVIHSAPRKIPDFVDSEHPTHPGEN